MLRQTTQRSRLSGRYSREPCASSALAAEFPSPFELRHSPYRALSKEAPPPPQQPRYPMATVLRLPRPSPFCHSERSRGICCAPFGCPQFTGLQLLPFVCHPESL